MFSSQYNCKAWGQRSRVATNSGLASKKKINKI